MLSRRDVEIDIYYALRDKSGQQIHGPDSRKDIVSAHARALATESMFALHGHLEVQSRGTTPQKQESFSLKQSTKKLSCDVLVPTAKSIHLATTSGPSLTETAFIRQVIV